MKLTCLIFFAILSISISSAQFFGFDDDNGLFEKDDEEEEYKSEEVDTKTILTSCNLDFKSQASTSGAQNKFEKFKMISVKNAENIFNEASCNIQNASFVSMKDINRKLRDRDFKTKVAEMENKRTKLQTILVQINDNEEDQNIPELVEMKNEYSKKIDELKAKKSTLSGSEARSIDVEISEQQKFLQTLNSDKSTKKSFIYQLINDGFSKEIEEYKKRDQLINVVDKFKTHGDNIENIFKKLKNDVIAQVTSYFETTKSKIQNNDKNNNMFIMSRADIYGLFDYEFVNFNPQSQSIPSYAVSSGTDLDGSLLYVIRQHSGGKYNFGKFASSRREAYINTGSSENRVTSTVEILTARNYRWCNYDTYKGSVFTLPVCRAKASSSTVPGEFSSDGSCLIGFGRAALSHTRNFEIISFEPCEAVRKSVLNHVLDKIDYV